MTTEAAIQEPITAQAQLDLARGRLAELKARAADLETSIDGHVKQVGDRIAADAIGERPYPGDGRDSDRGLLVELRAQLDETQAAITALGERLVSLEASNWTERGHVLEADMEALCKDAATTFEGYIDAAAFLVGKGRELHALRQRYRELEAQWSKAMDRSGEAWPIPAESIWPVRELEAVKILAAHIEHPEYRPGGVCSLDVKHFTS